MSSVPSLRLRMWPGSRPAIRSSASREATMVCTSLTASSASGIAIRCDIFRRSFSSDLRGVERGAHARGGQGLERMHQRVRRLGVAARQARGSRRRNRPCASAGTRSRAIQVQIGSSVARAMRPGALRSPCVSMRNGSSGRKNARAGAPMRGAFAARRSRAPRRAPPAAACRRRESHRHAARRARAPS